MNGVGEGRVEQGKGWTALGMGRVAHRELPNIRALLEGLWHGWLAPYRMRRHDQGWGELEARAGAEEHRRASRAWDAALTIAEDVLGQAQRSAKDQERDLSRRQVLRLVRRPLPSVA
jgi:hypothetical protein